MTATIAGSWPQRWRNILDRTRRVETKAELQQLLTSLCAPAAPEILAFVNAHAMNSMARSDTFFHALGSADVILRDGAGMAALFKLLALSPGLNLNGTDLIPIIISGFNGKGIALLGTREPYLHRASVNIGQLLAPQSQLITADGFRSAEAYLALALQHRPELIVLGMGMPKQENVAMALRAALPFPCLIICGGAIIDFIGAKTSRAPPLMRQVGLEWLYRLALEPRRLFRRYVVGNPLFLLRALQFVRSGNAPKNSEPD